MAIQSADGKLHSHDLQVQRVGNGTIGDDHIVNSGIDPRSLNRDIDLTDPAIQYFGGTSGGTWSITVGTAGTKYRHGSVATCNTPGAQVAINFSGSKVTIIGALRSDGGKFDAYIDGDLYAGITAYTGYIPANIPTSQQSFPSDSQIGVLSSTSTSVACDSTSFSGFTTSGTIKIDDEYITYSSVDAVNHYFTGCTRGANGSSAATHNIGSTIYNVDTGVDTYSATQKTREVLWSANNLSKNDHQLVLQIRADKNASSSDTKLYLESIVAGGLIGGPAINTHWRSFNVGNFTTDGSGTVVIGNADDLIQDEQVISLLGIGSDNQNCTYSLDAAGNVYLVGATSTTFNNVKLFYVTLGASV